MRLRRARAGRANVALQRGELIEASELSFSRGPQRKSQSVSAGFVFSIGGASISAYRRHEAKRGGEEKRGRLVSARTIVKVRAAKGGNSLELYWAELRQ